ncbi:DUF3488 and transglutaminase-like domain-containing protein [Streptomyces sp. S.PB5]|uniref:transglutaminase family protein n=1 Tax=Streptomyces sp. S.PB5 TaxID=3020844 RepID=UPI0025B1A943|nr:DUF3488 and transglutaminase-like domain-containing protein [Streptomyces sp. S.PB5]MDN3020836.1 DUF3488 and transglutaminase-like domain-containing protein [Streptomyces sp. S.PB5]
MSGRARLALCAWAATLMASCAMLPLVEPATWILQAGFLLGIQSLVGAATRRVPLARPLTVAAQALVTLMMLTLAFTREQALGGLVPGPEAFQRFADLLQQGSDDIARYAIPAPLESDGIRLMIVGGVLVIGLAVDALAVTFRSAAPAGLPLLALYSVAAGLSDGGSDWLWFLVAAAGYLTLLLAEGRDRLSQWGRVFGGAPRTPGGESGVVAPVRTGRRIGAVALGLALVVPVALPAMDGGLLDGAGAGVGGGNGSGGTISAVNPLLSLRDNLNLDQDKKVLTLRTKPEDQSSLYMRIVSLDKFDGKVWEASKRDIAPVPDEFPNPVGLGADVRRAEITTLVAADKGYKQDWLPMPYPPSGVQIDGNWRYEPEGMALVGDKGQNTGGSTYEVKSLVVQPTAEQLAAAPAPPADLKAWYTKLPSSLPPVVASTAREVTKGSANHYEQAVKLQEYFSLTGGFQYDTQVSVGTGSRAIANFLRDKQGFCIHFSFAMASMARSLGIPARVAVGFAPGTPEADGTVTVGLRDAHAWPELYFEGVGWTRFEPTPTRGTLPEYTQTDSPNTSLPSIGSPSSSASTAPSTSASASESCSAEQKKLDACPSESSAALPVTEDDGPKWYVVLAWALGGLAALVIPLAPMLWRRRVRATRLGAHGRGEADVAPHTLAVWLELTDTAWDFGILPDDSQTPRKAAARIVRLGHLDPAAAAAVHRVADAVEQVLYAPRPRPTAGLAEDVRRAIAGLADPAPRGTELRAMFAPRSTVRVVWAFSEWWNGVTARAAAARPTLRKPSGQQG